MKYQKGELTLTMMIGAMLLMTFASLWVKFYGISKFDELKEDKFKQSVIDEANNLDTMVKLVDAWFETEGKGVLYPCESPSVGTADPACDAGVVKTILPTYRNQISTTRSFNSLDSDTIWRVTVIKQSAAPQPGYVYKKVFFPIPAVNGSRG